MRDFHHTSSCDRVNRAYSRCFCFQHQNPVASGWHGFRSIGVKQDISTFLETVPAGSRDDAMKSIRASQLSPIPAVYIVKRTFRGDSVHNRKTATQDEIATVFSIKTMI